MTVSTMSPPPSGAGPYLAATLLALLAAWLLTGCRTPAPLARTETVEVFVPVVEPCPAPPVVARPALPLGALDSLSTPDEVLRAYASSAWLLAGYAQEIEMLLGAYRPDTTAAAAME